MSEQPQNDFFDLDSLPPTGAGVEKKEEPLKQPENKEQVNEIETGLNLDNYSRISYEDYLEKYQDRLDSSFEKKEDFFKKEFLGEFNGEKENLDYLKTIIEKNDLKNISMQEVLSLKGNYMDISKLFLEKLPKEEGIIQSFIVNFGGNKELNSMLGIGDMIDIYSYDKVRITPYKGGTPVEGTRQFSPRPGYYDANGKYLPVFDGYKVEVLSEIHLSKDEMKDYDNAFNERYDEVSKKSLVSKLIKDVKKDSGINELKLDYYSEKEKSQLSSILKKEQLNSGLLEDIRIENNTLISEYGNLYDYLKSINLIQAVGYENYKDDIDEVLKLFPKIDENKLIQLINHENDTWDPLRGAPGSTAYGLGQMIDDTWTIYGKGLDRNSGGDQLIATCKYLTDIMERKGVGMELAMAYYNTGEGIMNISSEKLANYIRLNTPISKLMEGSKTNQNYFIAAVSYYNNITFEEAKKFV